MTASETTIDDILETFEFIDDWEERYGVIIDLGKNLADLDDVYKVDAYKVRGCQSQVWLVPSFEGDVITFKGDSDAVIVRGLVALMLVIFSGKTAAEILAIDAKAILEQMGLKDHLSPLRANGLFAMVERIGDIARSR